MTKQDDPSETHKTCCSARREGGAGAAAPAIKGRASDALQSAVDAMMVPLPGGFFEMGARKNRYPADMDAPRRRVHVNPFKIGRTTIPNHLFARFVAETGYETTAETEKWSYVFHLFVEDDEKYPNSPLETPWWRQVHGAIWSAPEGPGTDWTGREDHPAVHISWFDAAAFADYVGCRLPREAEWEYAARGGLKGKRFPWGNTLEPESGHRHNVWQGKFPYINTEEDGFAGTCPVDHFPPNDFGLFNMTGNVWEWCADDWGPLPGQVNKLIRDPVRTGSGEQKVIRGGSHMCHASYCERYQVHSRTQNTPDSTTTHTGFRLVAEC